MEFDQGWGQGGGSALLPVGLSCCSLLNSRSFWEGVRMMSFSRWASGHLGSNPTGLWGHPHVPALWLFLSLKAALARGAWTQARPASYPTCLGPEKVRADSPQGAVRLSPCSWALQTLCFSGRKGMDLLACVLHVIPRDRNTGCWARGATQSSGRRPTSTTGCVERLRT